MPLGPGLEDEQLLVPSAEMARIALNGLGRIGKLALRDLIDTGAGGEIVLVSELGKGSEFTIRIPWRYREPRREINMGDTLDGLSLTDGPIAGQTSVAPGPSLGIGDP